MSDVQKSPSGTSALIAETMRRSLGLSVEQWAQLYDDTPATVELSRAIGRCLAPDVNLSAEIVAMRED